MASRGWDRKGRLALTGALLATCLFGASRVATASGAGRSAPQSAAEPELDLCVIDNKTDHPSIQAIHRGMEETAQYYPVSLEYFDPNGDPQRQIAQIDDCIAREFDVLLLNAVDPAAVVPGIKRSVEAGIPVVMHNADTNEEGQQYT